MENTKKKEKISNEIPRDLQREIMSWLPGKSLMRFSAVSKHWSSTFNDQTFKDSHSERSNTRPRVLFVFCLNELEPNFVHPQLHDFLFHSVYQQEEPLLSSGKQQMRITNAPVNQISAPQRGLICLQSNTTVVICNPSIRKFVPLPECNGLIVRSLFGYDKELDVFKVLCSHSPLPDQPIGSNEFKIYTLGSGEKSWREIYCRDFWHAIITNSLCIRGVIYYGAWDTNDNRNKSILMSFNVGTEEFTVIEVPKRVKIRFSTRLVNYNGNVAIVTDSAITTGRVKMSVWYDTTREWQRESFLIRDWRKKFGDMRFSFEGTIGTGEFVFTQIGLLDDRKSFKVVYYDRAAKKLREFKIEGGADERRSYDFARTFLNHVDSTLLA